MWRIDFMEKKFVLHFENQGNYLIPCLKTKEQKEVHVGVWANRHRQYLKQHHRIRYCNLLTSEKLYDYLADIEEQSEKMFEDAVLCETVPYCDIKESEIATYLLKPNDILFARTGGTVGKSYLVQDVPEEAICAGYLIRTRYSAQLCPQLFLFTSKGV